MPNRRAITIAAGVGFTDIPVSGPYHYARFHEVGNLQLDYQTRLDSFASTEATNAELGHVFEMRGAGRAGIIARPADYAAVGHPAAAQVMAKVRTTGAAGGTLIVEEYELEP